MKEVREFILNEIEDKIHSKDEIGAKVREKFSCPPSQHILDLTIERKLVQVGSFLLPFQEYRRAKERISQVLSEEGRIYLPILKPNSAEQHIVDQMIDSGRLYKGGDGYASPYVHEVGENHTLTAPELVYQFRKMGFTDLRNCKDREIIERFRRLVRDGTAREFEGRYIHRKVYQEMLIDAERSDGQDWVSKAASLSQNYRLPYEIVAGLVTKK